MCRQTALDTQAALARRASNRPMLVEHIEREGCKVIPLTAAANTWPQTAPVVFATRPVFSCVFSRYGYNRAAVRKIAATRSQEMDIEVRVCGIPAIARVTFYRPGSPGYLSGPPDRCYPPEPAELEWRLLDRRGRPAPWLERKLTERERERIERELVEYLETESEYME